MIGYAEQKKVSLCMEILNTRDSSHPMKGHPGYFGDDVERCIDLIKRVDSPRMKLLFDVYHVQVMNGDVIRRIRQLRTTSVTTTSRACRVATNRMRRKRSTTRPSCGRFSPPATPGWYPWSSSPLGRTNSPPCATRYASATCDRFCTVGRRDTQGHACIQSLLGIKRRSGVTTPKHILLKMAFDAGYEAGETPPAANSWPKRRPCKWRSTTWTARQGGLLRWRSW